jgi:glycosyltransferase involved in cell wall biosynthesis
MKQLDIIIPVRKGDSPEVTIKSLARQTFKDFNIIISQDAGANANAARNEGFKLSKAPYVLFSDNDIEWYPDAISILVNKLNICKAASYAYGAYYLDKELKCNKFFNIALLKQINYISTMSVIRREHFISFDPEIRRLQDWDLWLGMLAKEYYGVFCGKIIFQTKSKLGCISSSDNTYTWDAARLDVLKKHKLLGNL